MSIGVVAQLRDRARLDLANPLACEIQVLADLFERARLTVMETETQLDDVAFPLIEGAMSRSIAAGSRARAAPSNGDSTVWSSTSSPRSPSPASPSGFDNDTG